MNFNAGAKGLVVITGASSGIGAATARALSAAGYPVALLARRLDNLKALNIPNSVCIKTDVTDFTSVQDAIKEAEAKHGPTTVLVNNAGVMLLHDASTQPRDEWQKMLDVNLKGLFNCISAVLAGMKERKTGTIVNISSVAGRKGFANHAFYCATKFAVSGFSETLREEMSGSNVRVCSVCPGAVETELLSHTTDDSIKKGYGEWKDQIGGAIAADDVARAIKFIVEQPQNVCIREVVLAATGQAP